MLLNKVRINLMHRIKSTDSAVRLSLIHESLPKITMEEKAPGINEITSEYNRMLVCCSFKGSLSGEAKDYIGPQQVPRLHGAGETFCFTTAALRGRCDIIRYPDRSVCIAFLLLTSSVRLV